MESGLTEREAGRRIGVAWLWVAIGAVACAGMTPLEPSLLEEGLLVHFAQRMRAGEHLYRDLVFFSGPLPFEALALLFRIFGEEIAVGRTALVGLTGLATGALYALAARAGTGAMAAVPAAALAAAPILLFPLYSSYFYTTLALHGSVLAAYATLRGARSDGWAVLAGVAVAAVALTKQSTGLVLSVGLLGALWCAAPAALRARRAGRMVAGAAGLALATLAFYALRGDLAALVDALVALPLSLESSFASPTVDFWPIGTFSPAIERSQDFYVPHVYRVLTGEEGRVPAWMVVVTQALYALPWLALAHLALRRWLSGPLPAAVWMHAVVLAVGIANLFPRADWGHLVFALPAAASQLWITGFATPAGAARSRGHAFGLAALAVAIGIAAACLPVAIALHRLAEPAGLGERVPQRAVSRAYRDPGLARAVRFLTQRARPDEPIFVARSEPLLYFATGRRNPTPFGGVLPARRAGQSERIVAALAGVRFVVMSEIDQPSFLYYRDELPGVQAHLERFFRLAPSYQRRPSWLVVLERVPDRGEVVVDLFDARAQARAWVRDAAGAPALAPAPAPAPKLATRSHRRPLAMLVGAGGGGLDYELVLPEDAVFRADVGLARVEGPAGPLVHVRGARLELSVGQGEHPFERLASRRVRIGRGEGLAWQPLEVDLAAYAGRRVTLRLQASGEAALRPGGLAWWGSPGIVVR
jgi:hypothetical protein